MALLDVEQHKQIGSKGLQREIDENASSLILDTIQITQYQYPEASTVRELTSNAIDSQNEKLKAIEILKGEASEEQYYIRRDDPKYKDSNFDLNYYDLNYLDTDNNDVELSYICGTGGGWCDKFIIKDYGVGLGGKRLQGYFKIGFSTKRNTTKALGGFGFGSKVSLSLRNDYYDVISAHNGKLFKFRCYAYKLDSLVSRFNDNGTENQFETFYDNKGENPYKVYYEKTDLKNFTQIEVPCKTFHRQKIKDSVENQLLYLSGVKFKYVDEYGNVSNQVFQANVLYNSNNLIISDQRQYQKPHIVIVKDIEQPTGVCYGYVNFNELEMQDLYSYVGFKCPMRQVIRDEDGKEIVIQEGVEVTPSRESVVWSDHTREYLQKIISNAVNEAEGIVQKELNETNLLKWISKGISIKTGQGSNWVLNNISKITDITELTPRYPLNNDIKLTGIDSFFAGFLIKHVNLASKYVRSKGYENFIERKYCAKWSDFVNASAIYLMDEEDRANNRKDHYIVKSSNSSRGFITIKLLSDDSLKNYLFNNDFDHPKFHWCKNEEDFEKIKANRDFILEKLKVEAINYSSFVVPDGFNSTLKSEEELVTEEIEESKVNDPYKGLTPAERRLLTNEIVIQHPEFTNSNDTLELTDKPFTYKAKNVKLDDFIEDKAEIFYGLGVEEQDYVNIASFVSLNGLNTEVNYYHRYRNYLTQVGFTNEKKIIRVPSSMPKKLLANHRHIFSFFGFKPLFTNNDTKIIMDENLVKYNTAKLIIKDLKTFSFLEDYSSVHEVAHKIYRELVDYTKNFVDIEDIRVNKDVKASVNGFLNKLTNFSEYKFNNPNDKEGLKALSLDLFGVETIEDVNAIDYNVYNKFLALKTYSNDIKHLFNNIDFSTLSFEGYNLINKFLDHCGLSGFDFSEFNIDLTSYLPQVDTTESVDNESLVEEEVENEVEDVF